ncbi:ribosomal rna methyltransferase mrm2 [Ophiostoma piceae UAMH 11346]|uniref:rRNA methyltransferase 2, mitochondrial n=1 Tax=Ophiostoma piceae (strain UAMH 11346) TaxID=1262450 RepID=S3D935_OPHP1|nr:ribosomal rna methyltransferase mrm2 [Ophiostoma piceae UAMH 11346]
MACLVHICDSAVPPSPTGFEKRAKPAREATPKTCALQLEPLIHWAPHLADRPVLFQVAADYYAVGVYANFVNGVLPTRLEVLGDNTVSGFSIGTSSVESARSSSVVVGIVVVALAIFILTRYIYPYSSASIPTHATVTEKDRPAAGRVPCATSLNGNRPRSILTTAIDTGGDRTASRLQNKPMGVPVMYISLLLHQCHNSRLFIIKYPLAGTAEQGLICARGQSPGPEEPGRFQATGGSWSQVAVERTKPNGRVVGIDLIPAQPPRGVSTIQGNFLSPAVRELVKELLAQPPASPKTPAVSRPKPTEPDDNKGVIFEEPENDDADQDGADAVAPATPEAPNDTVAVDRLSYLESERQATASAPVHDTKVDIVLSDMSAPWPQTYGFWLNTLSNPYRRMMNTSGNAFRDHAGSMDLCLAALEFASDTLRTGGHFVCKFYQGGEDKAFEMRLKKMFTKVVREKPGSSRSESKESFFVALKRKKGVKWDDIKDM